MSGTCFDMFLFRTSCPDAACPNTLSGVADIHAEDFHASRSKNPRGEKFEGLPFVPGKFTPGQKRSASGRTLDFPHSCRASWV